MNFPETVITFVACIDKAMTMFVKIQPRFRRSEFHLKAIELFLFRKPDDGSHCEMSAGLAHKKQFMRNTPVVWDNI